MAFGQVQDLRQKRQEKLQKMSLEVENTLRNVTLDQSEEVFTHKVFCIC